MPRILALSAESCLKENKTEKRAALAVMLKYVHRDLDKSPSLPPVPATLSFTDPRNVRAAQLFDRVFRLGGRARVCE